MELNNISILNLMPPNLASDLKIKMAAEAFDEVLRDIIEKIPNVSVIPNLVLNKTVDAVLIDLLAWQFHVDFYDPKMPIEVRRDLVLKSLDWHFRKGTPSVVEDIVSTVFSKAVVQEWFDYGGLPYHFRIGTEDELPDESTRETLYRAIYSVKNTRSFLEKITSMIYFEDEFNVSDSLIMAIRFTMFEDCHKKFLYNGMIKYDGFTANKRIKAYGHYDGRFSHIGGLMYNGTGFRAPAYRPVSPFQYSSGISDKMTLWENSNVTDSAVIHDEYFTGMRKHHFSNGDYSYNGVIKYDGMVLIPLG